MISGCGLGQEVLVTAVPVHEAEVVLAVTAAPSADTHWVVPVVTELSASFSGETKKNWITSQHNPLAD